MFDLVLNISDPNEHDFTLVTHKVATGIKWNNGKIKFLPLINCKTKCSWERKLSLFVKREL